MDVSDFQFVSYDCLLRSHVKFLFRQDTNFSSYAGAGISSFFMTIFLHVKRRYFERFVYYSLILNYLQ